MPALPSSATLGRALRDQLDNDSQIGTGSMQLAAGNHTHSDATTGTAGFMSATDKSKLDGIAEGATGATDWGEIGGTIGDQTDLQNALVAKANLSHSHGITDLNTSGTASSSTFLRGDGEWASPAGSGDVVKVGTPVAGRMAVWAGDGTLSHFSGFTFDDGTETLTVTRIIIGGVTFDGQNQLADPDVNSLLGWDDGAGTTIWYTPTGGIEISGTDLRLTAAAGAKEIAITVFDTDATVAVGDGKKMIPIPATFNGMNITEVRAYVHTQGVTGATSVALRRRRAGTDVEVLSTLVTVGAEFHAADGVINAANDDLATGDVLLVDIDAVHTTPPTGLAVAIICQLP